ncbi:MAG: DUF305 domain-containing protein [Actinomycetota bacterium]|jgi:uncharacterized protein (DUF305 family)|uniref:DUF305 domain-containing protein n=1 Tax=Euzebya pacifica TaxID=1608957 RepID=UPI0030FB9657
MLASHAEPVGAETGGPDRDWWPIGLVVVAALVGAAAAVVLVSPSMPGDGSVEAGFARDMSTHHAQAVRMAGLISDRTTDEELLVLAEDITLSQQAQIGQMLGWLDIWGLPAAGSGPPMAWMDMGDMPMTGMASTETVDALGAAGAVDAERLFLELMIDHHRGGVEMAEGLLERSDHPVVRQLAGSILDSQSGEIELMERLLVDRS